MSPPEGPTLCLVYGPPAVGKLTVAKEIAARTGYRLVHNHVSIDPVLVQQIDVVGAQTLQ